MQGDISDPVAVPVTDRIWPVLLCAVLMASAVTTASANPPRSRLTPIDLDQCRVLPAPPGEQAWRCQGLPGFPVYVTARPGGTVKTSRYAISFGPDGEQHSSANQSPGDANTIFDGKRRPTVEWRIVHLGRGSEQPFATIVRYHAVRRGEARELLVITKVGPGVSCHMAVVDASAAGDAMALARRWADAHVRQRGCPERADILAGSSRATPEPFKPIGD